MSLKQLDAKFSKKEIRDFSVTICYAIILPLGVILYTNLYIKNSNILSKNSSIIRKESLGNIIYVKWTNVTIDGEDW